jgi:hypothetical protein
VAGVTALVDLLTRSGATGWNWLVFVLALVEITVYLAKVRIIVEPMWITRRYRLLPGRAYQLAMARIVDVNVEPRRVWSGRVLGRVILTLDNGAQQELLFEQAEETTQLVAEKIRYYSRMRKRLGVSTSPNGAQ